MSKTINHLFEEIKYKGYKFPGIFLRAENSNKPKPTILFHNGGESHKEDTFFLGVPGPEEKPVPFHLYTMRQAIEEGFILDVLGNYITYDLFYKVAKRIKEDPKYDICPFHQGVKLNQLVLV